MSSFNSLIFKNYSGLKAHSLFLLLLTLSMVYVFSSIKDLGLLEWDYTEFLYYLNNQYVHPPINPLSLAEFYLFNQYGTTYALIEIPRLIVGYSSVWYPVINIVIRAIAAISLYFLAFKWTNKKLLALIVGLFFAIGMPGIQSTIWVVQFFSYVAVILLCLSLFFWKKFHDFPTWQNLKLSVLFFAIALFISHIRLPNLPIIILVGEIYYFFKEKKHYHKLNRKHAFYLFTIFLVLFLTSSISITVQVFKLVSPHILLKALLNGYPPIIYSYFLLLSNTIIPTDILTEFVGLFRIGSYISNTKLILFFILTIVCIFFVINLIKKNFLIAGLSSWGIVFPIALYLTNKGVWDETTLAQVLIGGTLFILILIGIFMIKKIKNNDIEIALLGVLIMISSLILPWVGFPLTESTIQAAYGAAHRYYIVPLAGISLVWGFLFNFFFYSITKNFRLSYKNLIFFLLLILLSLSLIFHGLNTQKILFSKTQLNDRVGTEKKWALVKPIFQIIEGKHSKKIVYFEGDLNEKVRYNIMNLFGSRLNLEFGFRDSVGANSVLFIDDKKRLKELLSEENAIEEDSFFAFKFTSDKLVDVKSQVINELKGQK